MVTEHQALKPTEEPEDQKPNSISEDELQQIQAAAKEKIKEVKEKSALKLANLKQELVEMAKYAKVGDEERSRLSEALTEAETTK